MYALTTQDVHGVILLNGIIRRLMPIECFRLQGFADNQFQTLADNGISDSQLYKNGGQLGYHQCRNGDCTKARLGNQSITK